MTDSQDSAPSNPPNSELLLKLDELVSKLRPAERDALVLRFLQGLDLRAAASSLGISEDASSLPLNETDAHQLLTRAMKVEQIADARAFDLTVYGENASYPTAFATRIAAEYVAQSEKLTPRMRVRVLGKAFQSNPHEAA